MTEASKSNAYNRTTAALPLNGPRRPHELGKWGWEGRTPDREKNDIRSGASDTAHANVKRPNTTRNTASVDVG
jgi:hypothetical protein